MRVCHPEQKVFIKLTESEGGSKDDSKTHCCEHKRFMPYFPSNTVTPFSKDPRNKQTFRSRPRNKLWSPSSFDC